jgi:hypothetical protein
VTTRFVGFADGQGALYFAGGEGDRNHIWGIAVVAEGTSLGAPVIQGQVPAGEVITALYGYLGFLIVGTNMGVRMCTTANSGAVTLGALIPTPHPVQGLVGWDRFVYFGWTAYDTASTGLGRMDLQNHVIAGVLPAWSSDLMAPGQAAVSSVLAIADPESGTEDAGEEPESDNIIFAVAGAGVYAADPAHRVAQGNVVTGLVMFDLTDPKAFTQIDVAGPIAWGSYTISLSVDGGDFKPVGTHEYDDPEPVTFSAGPTTGQQAELDVTLSRDAGNPVCSPVFTRWTLRAYPAPHRPLVWQVPIILNEAVVDLTDGTNSFDPLVELQAIESMAELGEMVTYQEGPNAYPVFVTDVAFLPTYPTRDHHFFNGIALLTLQGLPPAGAN